MWDSTGDGRPLPEWIESAYAVLEAHLSEREEDGVSRAEAHDILSNALSEEPELDPADAEYALQRLIDRGYLYEVAGEVFVTEPTEEMS